MKKRRRNRKHRKDRIVRKAFALIVVYLLISSLVNVQAFAKDDDYKQKIREILTNIRNGNEVSKEDMNLVAPSLGEDVVKKLSGKNLIHYVRAAGSRVEYLDNNQIANFLKTSGLKSLDSKKKRNIINRINKDILQRVGDLSKLYDDDKGKVLLEILKKEFPNLHSIESIELLVPGIKYENGKLTVDGTELVLGGVNGKTRIVAYEDSSGNKKIRFEPPPTELGGDLTVTALNKDGQVEFELPDGTTGTAQQLSNFFSNKGFVVSEEGTKITFTLKNGQKVTVNVHDRASIKLLEGGLDIKGAVQYSAQYSGENVRGQSHDTVKIIIDDGTLKIKQDGQGEVDIGNQKSRHDKASGKDWEVNYKDGKPAEIFVSKDSWFGINMHIKTDKRLVFRYNGNDEGLMPVFFFENDPSLISKYLKAGESLKSQAVMEALKKYANTDRNSNDYNKALNDLRNAINSIRRKESVLVGADGKLVIINGRGRVDTFAKSSNADNEWVERVLVSNKRDTQAVYLNQFGSYTVYASNPNNNEDKYFQAKDKLISKRGDETIDEKQWLEQTWSNVNDERVIKVNSAALQKGGEIIKDGGRLILAQLTVASDDSKLQLHNEATFQIYFNEVKNDGDGEVIPLSELGRRITPIFKELKGIQVVRQLLAGLSPKQIADFISDIQQVKKQDVMKVLDFIKQYQSLSGNPEAQEELKNNFFTNFDQSNFNQITDILNKVQSLQNSGRLYLDADKRKSFNDFVSSLTGLNSEQIYEIRDAGEALFSGKYQDAINKFEKAQDYVNPLGKQSLAALQLQIAKAHLENEDVEKAKQSIDKALANDPLSHEAIAFKATIIARESPRDASEWLKQKLENLKTKNVNRLVIKQLEEQQQRYGKQAEFQDEIKKLRESIAGGDGADKGEILKNAIALGNKYGTNAQLESLKAVLYANLENNDAAAFHSNLATFLQLLQDDFKFTAASAQLLRQSIAYIKDASNDELRRQLKVIDSASLTTEDKRTLDILMLTRGSVYENLGEIKNAEKSYIPVFKKNPANSEIALQAAQGLYRTRKELAKSGDKNDKNNFMFIGRWLGRKAVEKGELNKAAIFFGQSGNDAEVNKLIEETLSNKNIPINKKLALINLASQILGSKFKHAAASLKVVDSALKSALKSGTGDKVSLQAMKISLLKIAGKSEEARKEIRLFVEQNPLTEKEREVVNRIKKFETLNKAEQERLITILRIRAENSLINLNAAQNARDTAFRLIEIADATGNSALKSFAENLHRNAVVAKTRQLVLNGQNPDDFLQESKLQGVSDGHEIASDSLKVFEAEKLVKEGRVREAINKLTLIMKTLEKSGTRKDDIRYRIADQAVALAIQAHFRTLGNTGTVSKKAEELIGLLGDSTIVRYDGKEVKLKTYLEKAVKTQNEIARQNRIIIAERNRRIAEYNRRIAERNRIIAERNKRNRIIAERNRRIAESKETLAYIRGSINVVIEKAREEIRSVGKLQRRIREARSTNFGPRLGRYAIEKPLEIDEQLQELLLNPALTPEQRHRIKRLLFDNAKQSNEYVMAAQRNWQGNIFAHKRDIFALGPNYQDISRIASESTDLLAYRQREYELSSIGRRVEIEVSRLLEENNLKGAEDFLLKVGTGYSAIDPETGKLMVKGSVINIDGEVITQNLGLPESGFAALKLYEEKVNSDLRERITNGFRNSIFRLDRNINDNIEKLTQLGKKSDEISNSFLANFPVVNIWYNNNEEEKKIPELKEKLIGELQILQQAIDIGKLALDTNQDGREPVLSEDEIRKFEITKARADKALELDRQRILSAAVRQFTGVDPRTGESTFGNKFNVALSGMVRAPRIAPAAQDFGFYLGQDDYTSSIDYFIKLSEQTGKPISELTELTDDMARELNLNVGAFRRYAKAYKDGPVTLDTSASQLTGYEQFLDTISSPGQYLLTRFAVSPAFGLIGKGARAGGAVVSRTPIVGKLYNAVASSAPAAFVSEKLIRAPFKLVDDLGTAIFGAVDDVVAEGLYTQSGALTLKGAAKIFMTEPKTALRLFVEETTRPASYSSAITDLVRFQVVEIGLSEHGLEPLYGKTAEAVFKTVGTRALSKVIGEGAAEGISKSVSEMAGDLAELATGKAANVGLELSLKNQGADVRVRAGATVNGMFDRIAEYTDEKKFNEESVKGKDGFSNFERTAGLVQGLKTGQLRRVEVKDNEGNLQRVEYFQGRDAIVAQTFKGAKGYILALEDPVSLVITKDDGESELATGLQVNDLDIALDGLQGRQGFADRILGIGGQKGVSNVHVNRDTNGQITAITYTKEIGDAKHVQVLYRSEIPESLKIAEPGVLGRRILTVNVRKGISPETILQHSRANELYLQILGDHLGEEGSSARLVSDGILVTTDGDQKNEIIHEFSLLDVKGEDAVEVAKRILLKNGFSDEDIESTENEVLASNKEIGNFILHIGNINDARNVITACASCPIKEGKTIDFKGTNLKVVRKIASEVKTISLFTLEDPDYLRSAQERAAANSENPRAWSIAGKLAVAKHLEVYDVPHYAKKLAAQGYKEVSKARNYVVMQRNGETIVLSKPGVEVSKIKLPFTNVKGKRITKRISLIRINQAELIADAKVEQARMQLDALKNIADALKNIAGQNENEDLASFLEQARKKLENAHEKSREERQRLEEEAAREIRIAKNSLGLDLTAEEKLADLNERLTQIEEAANSKYQEILDLKNQIKELEERSEKELERSEKEGESEDVLKRKQDLLKEKRGEYAKLQQEAEDLLRNREEIVKNQKKFEDMVNAHSQVIENRDAIARTLSVGGHDVEVEDVIEAYEQLELNIEEDKITQRGKFKEEYNNLEEKTPEVEALNYLFDNALYALDNVVLYIRNVDKVKRLASEFEVKTLDSEFGELETSEAEPRTGSEVSLEKTEETAAKGTQGEEPGLGRETERIAEPESSNRLADQQTQTAEERKPTEAERAKKSGIWRRVVGVSAAIAGLGLVSLDTSVIGTDVVGLIGPAFMVGGAALLVGIPAAVIKAVNIAKRGIGALFKTAIGSQDNIEGAKKVASEEETPSEEEALRKKILESLPLSQQERSELKSASLSGLKELKNLYNEVINARAAATRTVTTPSGREVALYENVPERVVAIGDVHGDYDGLIENLRNTGIVNKDGDWIGGNAVLVQVGDVIDRGPKSVESYEYLGRLQEQAEKAGGKVVRLIGNHELFLLQGYKEYTERTQGPTPEKREDPDTVYSELKYINWRYHNFYEGNEEDNEKKNREAIIYLAELLIQDIKEGRVQAASVHGGRLFVHGGAIPKFTLDRTAEEVADNLNQILKDAVENQEYTDDIFAVGWARRGTGEPGIFWADFAEELPTYSELFPQVVGHTPERREGAGIRTSDDGNVINIDVGMFKDYGGNREALVFQGNEVKATRSTTPLTQALDDFDKKVEELKSTKDSSKASTGSVHYAVLSDFFGDRVDVKVGAFQILPDGTRTLYVASNIEELIRKAFHGLSEDDVKAEAFEIRRSLDLHERIHEVLALFREDGVDIISDVEAEEILVKALIARMRGDENQNPVIDELSSRVENSESERAEEVLKVLTGETTHIDVTGVEGQTITDADPGALLYAVAKQQYKDGLRDSVTISVDSEQLAELQGTVEYESVAERRPQQVTRQGFIPELVTIRLAAAASVAGIPALPGMTAQLAGINLHPKVSRVIPLSAHHEPESTTREAVKPKTQQILTQIQQEEDLEKRKSLRRLFAEEAVKVADIDDRQRFAAELARNGFKKELEIAAEIYRNANKGEDLVEPEEYIESYNELFGEFRDLVVEIFLRQLDNTIKEKTGIEEFTNKFKDALRGGDRGREALDFLIQNRQSIAQINHDSFKSLFRALEVLISVSTADYGLDPHFPKNKINNAFMLLSFIGINIDLVKPAFSELNRARVLEQATYNWMHTEGESDEQRRIHRKGKAVIGIDNEGKVKLLFFPGDGAVRGNHFQRLGEINSAFETRQGMKELASTTKKDDLIARGITPEMLAKFLGFEIFVDDQGRIYRIEINSQIDRVMKENDITPDAQTILDYTKRLIEAINPSLFADKFEGVTITNKNLRIREQSTEDNREVTRQLTADEFNERLREVARTQVAAAKASERAHKEAALAALEAIGTNPEELFCAG